jgi:hypothetical protein
MIRSALCIGTAGGLMLLAARVANQGADDCDVPTSQSQQWCWQNVLATPLVMIFDRQHATTINIAFSNLAITVLLLVIIQITLSYVLAPTYSWSSRRIRQHYCMAITMSILSAVVVGVGWLLFVLMVVAAERLHGSQPPIIAWCIAMTGMHLIVLAGWRALLSVCCGQRVSIASVLSIVLWLASEICMLVICIALIRDHRQNTFLDLESLLRGLIGDAPPVDFTDQTEETIVALCSTVIASSIGALNVIAYCHQLTVIELETELQRQWSACVCEDEIVDTKTLRFKPNSNAIPHSINIQLPCSGIDSFTHDTGVQHCTNSKIHHKHMHQTHTCKHSHDEIGLFLFLCNALQINAMWNIMVMASTNGVGFLWLCVNSKKRWITNCGRPSNNMIWNVLASSDSM